jgi:hypothetical protein
MSEHARWQASCNLASRAAIERYMAGAAIIACGGVAEILLGVDAERKSLESIASPLASRDAA